MCKGLCWAFGGIILISKTALIRQAIYLRGGHTLPLLKSRPSKRSYQGPCFHAWPRFLTDGRKTLEGCCRDQEADSCCSAPEIVVGWRRLNNLLSKDCRFPWWKHAHCGRLQAPAWCHWTQTYEERWLQVRWDFYWCAGEFCTQQSSAMELTLSKTRGPSIPGNWADVWCCQRQLKWNLALEGYKGRVWKWRVKDVW